MARADRRAMLRALAAGAAAGALAGRAAGAEPRSRPVPLARFSSLAPGARPPEPWREQTLPDVAPNRHSLVDDAGVTVLQIDSQASASSLLHPVSAPAVAAERLRLRWRWKKVAYPMRDGFGERRGDDFAARIYLMFDYPLQRVPFAQRMLLGLARVAHGDDVPAAALCYVLDPRAPAETLIESPYTSRVRMIVVRSTVENGRWWEEERDVARDFARAFGDEYGPGVAPLRAIAIAADSDQSRARLSTRFGDLALVES